MEIRSDIPRALLPPAQAAPLANDPVSEKRTEGTEPPSSDDAAIVTLSSEASNDERSRAAEPSAASIRAEGTNESSGEEGQTEERGEQSDEERKEVADLAKRDREVRSHEQAHLNALGAYRSGGASFTFATGPDGKRYAVGGEVPVDLSEESSPEATIRKMQTVRRAALAPAEPSGADRQVAAAASQIEARARAELAKGSDDEAKPQDIEETSAPEETAIADAPHAPSEDVRTKNPYSERTSAPSEHVQSVDIYA